MTSNRFQYIVLGCLRCLLKHAGNPYLIKDLERDYDKKIREEKEQEEEEDI